MRLYDYLDLRFQELRNAVSQNLQEPPEDPMSGLFYFNTDTKRWYIFDGEKWVDCTLQLIDFSCTITGITYNPETGEFSLDEGYVIPTIQQFQDLWDAIATETQARIDADILLQENIDAEELARINADTLLQANIDNEVQARINADNILQGNIDAEEQARINADSMLQDNIDAEATARENADTALGNRITNEIQAEAQARQQADTNLGNRITNEVGAEATDRQQADTALSGRIDNINSLIPTEATSTNKLADKEFVINNIQTSSANFRGSWATWSAVPTNANFYPVDVDGNRTPTKNDYMIVLADETRDGGTWRYKYTGIWNTNGKQGWKAEYEIEKSPFTPEEQAAIDSGITSTLVAQITTNQGDISDINTTIGGYGDIVTHDVDEFATAAQGDLAGSAIQPNDNITQLTNNAGYITNSALTPLQNSIDSINDKIPNQASSSNQLADKSFVNSSIATNTATFIGTFNSVAELEAYSGTVTNNDYAFVIGTDADGNTVYDRYKYNAEEQEWLFEYELNNSSFTAEQWESINSGITSGDVSLISSALQPNDNISELNNDVGYTTNVGTVTSVNNNSPDSSGNVTISTGNTYTAGTGLQLSSQNEFNILQQDYGTPNPYTVYGSPIEISDKVYNISGDRNYITANCDFIVNPYDTFEIIIKFKDLSVSRYLSLCGNYYGGLYLWSRASAKVYGWFISRNLGGGSSGTNVETGDYFSSYDVENNYCYVKLERTTNNYIVYASTDGETWTQTGTRTRATQSSNITISPFGYGNVASTTKMSAIVDLNGCSIKVNDDYIFNPAGNVYKEVAKATNSLYGLVKPDNSTITVNNGVISGFSGVYDDLSNKPNIPSITFYWGE